MLSKRFEKRKNIGAHAVSTTLRIQLYDIVNDEQSLFLFGRNEAGESVSIVTNTFKHYFILAFNNATQSEFVEKSIELVKSLPGVHNVSRMPQKQFRNMHHFTTEFLDIIFQVQLDKLTDCIGNHLQRIKQNICDDANFFETDLNACQRFSLDTGVHCGGWYNLNLLEIGGVVDKSRQKTIVTHEYHTNTIKGVKLRGVSKCSDEQNNSLASFKLLGLDIECDNKPGQFPSAEKDAIIHVGLVHSHIDTMSGKFVTHRRVDVVLVDVDNKEELTIKGYPHGIDFVCVSNERDLLDAMCEVVKNSDCDFIMGYNSEDFDFTYLFNRAVAIDHSNLYMGRVLNMSINNFKNSFSGKFYTNFFGRVSVDMMRVVKNIKLRSYKLNDVAEHFLHEKKDDVPPNKISEIHHRSVDGKLIIGRYCVRDAELTVLLAEKLGTIVFYIQLAKLTYLNVTHLLQRGQQIRVLNLIRIEGQQQQRRRQRRQRDDEQNSVNYLIPHRDRTNYDSVGGIKRKICGDSSKSYSGGAVIEPEPGLYNDPVITIDVNSLYPSIILAYNICFSTHITEDSPQSHTAVNIVANGERFVQRQQLLGIIPRACMKLIESRKQVKQKMKKIAVSDFQYTVFDNEQLAIKVVTNSIYGTLGAITSVLSRIKLAESVTTTGQRILLSTRNYVHNDFALESGIRSVQEGQISCTVCYGDTDSLFVQLKTESSPASVKNAFEIGNNLVKNINSNLPENINFEFEKVYSYLILFSKKKYIGLKQETINGPIKFEQRGIETVRRDTCAFIVDIMDKCMNCLVSGTHESIDVIFERIKEIVRYAVDEIKEKRVDYKQMSISKEYRKLSTMRTQIPQIFVATKMKVRDPGSAPNYGERIEFVILDRLCAENIANELGGPTYLGIRNITGLCVLAEDVTHAHNNRLPLNVDYYINKVLHPPLMRILMPLLSESQMKEFNNIVK